MKALVRRFLRRLDFDVVRISRKVDVAHFVLDRNIDLVLDVGANEGQFGRYLRAEGYTGRIRSFEPVSGAFEKLSEAARQDPRWEACNFALGAAPGWAAINVSASSDFSSLRPLSGAAATYRQAVVDHTEQIEIRPLDEVIGRPSGNVFLKIDTQGFEQSVLQGARATLPALRGVLMELPLIQLYEGNWSFQEAVAFMGDAGFVPAQIHPVSWHPADRVSFVEVDFLFRPVDPRLDGPGPRRCASCSIA